MADQDLATSLKLAKTKPMSFAFVARGMEGKLLLDKKKVSPRSASEAKKECGGGTIFRGRCLFEDGTMVFEVAKEPPGTLATLIKKIIKADASMTVNVIVRVNASLDEEEGSETEADNTEATPSGTPTADPLASGVMQRLNAMTAGIKTALTGPNAARVQPLFMAVNGAIKSQDYAHASKLLDELDALLGKPTPPTFSGAAVIQRLNAMSAGIKTALTGPNAARVQPLFIAVNGAIKGQDYAQASKVLDELEPLLGPATGDPLRAEWERLAGALEPRVLEAQKARAGEAQWMPIFMLGQELGGKGDFTRAIKVLTDLQARLDAPPPTLSSEPGGRSLRELASCRLDWLQVCATMRAEVDALQRAIISAYRADPAFDADDLEEVVRKVEELPNLVSALDETLAEEIDKVINAEPGPKRVAAQKAALKTTELYYDHVKSDADFALVDNNDFHPTHLKALALDALGAIKQELQLAI